MIDFRTNHEKKAMKKAPPRTQTATTTSEMSVWVPSPSHLLISFWALARYLLSINVSFNQLFKLCWLN